MSMGVPWLPLRVLNVLFCTQNVVRLGEGQQMTALLRVQNPAITRERGVRVPADPQPEYLRIAADLRSAILGGHFPAGAQLPTLPVLTERYGVSETTARNAIRVLAQEGLVESRTRAGTRVRERPPVHRITADRYRPRPGPATPFTADQDAQWEEYHLGKRFETTKATPEVAALFEVEPGERLLARHFVFYDKGTPSQMSTSYVRWSDVAGTPVADPIHEPWPGGTIAQMATLGHTVTRVEESMTAAMPTALEEQTLQLGPGVPVLRWTRRMLTATGRVVEVAHPIVRRGDTTVVDYAIDLG
jgi:GntR family transcriptional regulator